jgi:hypothetical protein
VSRDLQRKVVADLRNKKNASIELSSWRVPLPTVEIDGASLITIIFLSPVNPPRERFFFQRQHPIRWFYERNHCQMWNGYRLKQRWSDKDTGS